MNPLFTDRYVLADGTVILPEEIRGIELNGENESFVITLWDMCQFFGPLSDIRRDRNTGERDKDGKEIFENDRFVDRAGMMGTVVFNYAEWRMQYTTKSAMNASSSSLWGESGLTITGMVPFGGAQ